MTDEVPPTTDALPTEEVSLAKAATHPSPGPQSEADSSPRSDSPPEPVVVSEESGGALSRAQKLEAKAARLRENEAARLAAAARAGGVAPAPSRGLIITLASAAAVFFVAFALALGYGIHESNRAADSHKSAASAQNLDTLRASAAKTATAMAISFGTYDYTTLTADFARTRAYLAPSFAADYSKLTTSLGSVITQAKGKTVGTVDAVGITSISPTTAVVLVFLDQKVTTSQSTTPRLDHSRLKLTMVRQKNGSWLVSQLRAL